MTLGTVALFAIAGAACNAVFGLDAPTLDPCAGGCSDGAAPRGDDAGQVAIDGGALADSSTGDAPLDAIPDEGPLNGIRCGGGASAIGCAPASPVCCLDLDGGSASYSCEGTTAACGGYPIACATNNDCSGNDVCCHYSSGIKCVGETTCANAALVCDPAGPADQCPSGWTCTVAFTDGTYTLPYYGCTQ